MLEKLNAVSTAKRLANMVRRHSRFPERPCIPVLTKLCSGLPSCSAAQELHDSDFGKREEIHKIKRAKRAADVQETTVLP